MESVDAFDEGDRLAAPRSQRRRRRAALRGESRHRLLRQPARLVQGRAVEGRGPAVAGERRAARAEGDVGAPALRGAGRLHRMDRRQPPAPSSLPRYPRRQGSG